MKFNKPLFWNSINFVSVLLYPLSLLTFFINFLKKIPNTKKFKIKSICVGNIYIGGTGKTPLSIKVNSILKKNYKTVFIKKKYSDQIDEQNILRKHGKLICRERRDIALDVAAMQKYDVAILDDGLQNKNLCYNIKIACFNSSDCIGNGFLIPSGPLRENISEIKNNIKIFESKYIPINLKSFNLKKEFLFFCGVGNPSEFERTLKKYKIKVKEKVIFPDHYNFSNSDIFRIKKLAKSKKFNIITTEKDYLRLNKKNRQNISFLKIDLKIKNMQNFSKFLFENL